ncbi:MAG TPA: 50S ribosomal protein L29 [Acidobacteriota bacterium]|nr:50S ribosomal protein L29 [Acidobacteriota bacterium]
MKAKRFREMRVEDLRDEGKALSEQLFKLRLQKATGQLENVSKLRDVRRDLARCQTILNEKLKEEAAAG